jgi:hypothetical protein
MWKLTAFTEGVERTKLAGWLSMILKNRYGFTIDVWSNLPTCYVEIQPRQKTSSRRRMRRLILDLFEGGFVNLRLICGGLL